VHEHTSRAAANCPPTSYNEQLAVQCSKVDNYVEKLSFFFDENWEILSQNIGILAQNRQ